MVTLLVVLELAGLAALIAGAWLISPPAGLVATGAALLYEVRR